MTYDDEQRQLEAVREELLREFAEQLTAEVVQARFSAAVAQFDTAPVRTFVPVLVHRQVRELLVSA